MKRIWLILVVAVVLGAPAQADSITVDFDSVAPGVYDGTIGLSFAIGASGVTATLYRFGSTLEIVPTGGAMPGFDSQTLSPFNDPYGGPFFWIFDASGTERVIEVAFDAGDFTPSDTDVIGISLLLGNGGDSFSSTTLDGELSPGFNQEHFHRASHLGIEDFIFSGGTPENGESLFWDNFTFVTGDPITFGSGIDDLPTGGSTGGGADAKEGATGSTPTSPVPEPGTLGLLGAAFAAFVVYRRRRGAQ